MTLPTWYKIHAAVTIPFALPMVLLPRWFIELLTDAKMTELGIDLARLVGAAYLLITFLTWIAATELRRRAQVIVARVFCVYESIGVVVGLTIHFEAHADLARVITIGFFGTFAAGYLWFGFIEPRRTGAHAD
ncbi:MAG: hypothetical protein ACI9C1_003133 [Candidatus Aldehydirespiratoraceae bacterium]|jgi:hypothetical protein